MDIKKKLILTHVVDIINFFLLIVITTGLVKNNAFFKFYMFIGLSLVPIITQALSIYFVKKENFDIKNSYSLLHNLNYILLIILLSVKMILQLDKYICIELIIICAYFVITEIMLFAFFKFSNKYNSFKSYVVEQILSLLAYGIFAAILIILVFDYSIIV